MIDLDTTHNRRAFLGASGTLVLAASGLSTAKAWAKPRWEADPFSLGVASGEPTRDGVVLWTRLAPNPLGDEALPGRRVPVRWQVARDEHFHRIVQRGRTCATPELGHSVHVEVGDLRSDREYFFRFESGDAVSPVGRTRTAPGEDCPRAHRFAFVSCQMWEDGYWTAYRHLAEEDVSLVLHLGDYIYEDARLDKWDAYPVARQRLLDLLETERVADPVILTGDLHDNWVFDLKRDFAKPSSPTVGTEFIGTSISSDGDGAERSEEGEIALVENAHCKFHNFCRGYVCCDVTRKRWQTDFRVLPYVTTPGAPVSTRARFEVRDGQAGAEQVS